MRLTNIGAVILPVILGFGILHPTLLAQEEGETQEGQQEQKVIKKTSEGQGERAGTKVVPLSNSLSSYRVDFTLTEFEEGKKINSRSYSLTTQVGHRDKLRLGGRVPVATNIGASPPNAQFQYLDIGMNIDCSIPEQDGSVLINSTIDSSSAAPQPEPQTHQPVLRQMRYEVATVLTPGKPTIIGTMDDPTSKARFQLDVTAPKVR